MQFNQVVGQTVLKDRLIRSALESRLHHAQLFFGARGSGMLPMARAFASYLCCERPTEKDSCGTCSACRKNRNLTHPDVHYVFPVATVRKLKDPVSADFMEDWRQINTEQAYFGYTEWCEVLDTENKQLFIPVAESGSIIRQLSLKPFESTYKVFIIWLPELMRREAANALLKSFEEPPPNSVFILITEAREQLLATIQSRVQMIKFPRIHPADMLEALLAQGVEVATANEAVKISEGNYLTASDYINRQGENQQSEQDFLQWMRLCFQPTRSFQSLLQWVDEHAALSREQQKQFLFFCIRIVREGMLLPYVGREFVHMEPAKVTLLDKLLPFLEPGQAQLIYNALNDAIYQLERNAHSKILFLDLSMQIGVILNRRQQSLLAKD